MIQNNSCALMLNKVILNSSVGYLPLRSFAAVGVSVSRTAHAASNRVGFSSNFLIRCCRTLYARWCCSYNGFLVIVNSLVSMRSKRAVTVSGLRSVASFLEHFSNAILAAVSVKPCFLL